jgi:thiol-disulfide isomerase/thioredoxin
MRAAAPEPGKRSVLATAAGLLPFLVGIAACTPVDRQSADTTGALPAPMYSAVLMNGDSVSLAAQRGSVVLLNIWATYCIPCRDEMPLLQKLHEEQSGRGLRVVGVSVDARGAEERVSQFLTEYGVTFPIWLDPDERASFIFRAIGVPATYIITRDGKVIWQRLGPIEADDPKMKAALEEALSARG